MNSNTKIDANTNIFLNKYLFYCSDHLKKRRKYGQSSKPTTTALRLWSVKLFPIKRNQ